MLRISSSKEYLLSFFYHYAHLFRIAHNQEMKVKKTPLKTLETKLRQLCKSQYSCRSKITCAEKMWSYGQLLYIAFRQTLMRNAIQTSQGEESHLQVGIINKFLENYLASVDYNMISYLWNRILEDRPR